MLFSNNSFRNGLIYRLGVAIQKNMASMDIKFQIAMARLLAFFSFLILSLAVVQTTHAQNREIINPSFEDGPTPGTFVIGPDADHPGWNSTNGEMETWADGFQMRDAQQGDFLFELNPTEPVGLSKQL